MRYIVPLIVALAVAPVCPFAAARAEPARIALLIGNQAYAEKVGPLNNPHDDVDIVEAALSKVGFKVTVLKDAGYRAMATALKRFVREVNRAGGQAISFFYYSGHGVANPETHINYLIPIDVKEPEDEKIWDEAFQQNVIIDMLSTQAPKATHFVIFDACRNELHITGPASKALGTDKGFVPVHTMPGLLIAYATAPGRTASDNGTGGGPYAKALAEELVKPGLEAVEMFRKVQIKVKQSIGQDPWLSFPSLPEVYLAGKHEVPPPAAAQAPSICDQHWQRIKGMKSIPVLKDFVERCGADEAQGRIAHIRLAELEREAKEAELKAAKERARLAALSQKVNEMDKTVLIRKLQQQLQRLGCDPGEVDGVWGDKVKEALSQYMKETKLELDLDEPSNKTLEILTMHKTKVCVAAAASQPTRTVPRVRTSRSRSNPRPTRPRSTPFLP